MNRIEQSKSTQQRRKLIFGLLTISIITGLGVAYEFGPDDNKSTIFIIAGTYSFVVGCALIIFEYVDKTLKPSYGPNPNGKCTMCCFKLLICCGYRNHRECEYIPSTSVLRFQEAQEDPIQVCCETFCA